MRSLLLGGEAGFAAALKQCVAMQHVVKERCVVSQLRLVSVWQWLCSRAYVCAYVVLLVVGCTNSVGGKCACIMLVAASSDGAAAC